MRKRVGGLQLEEGAGQLHQHRTRHQAVGGDGQLRFPAGGHALDAVGHCVDVLQQSAALAQQLRAGLGHARLA
jgi:hypothetical protein